jgi:hypothetical protein
VLSSETVRAPLILFVVLKPEFYSSPRGGRTITTSASMPPRRVYDDARPLSRLGCLDPDVPTSQFEPAMAFSHQPYWRRAGVASADGGGDV